MRLKNIKLAGFKSFVDPTNVALQSNLVAVVGPNGCGKSNVIDAVRWVMGESAAKHLRGESITDVIFNGSTARQPIGQASVELHFDNSDGSLGGEYAAYPEIVIKRVVTRDGQSVYYLNNSRCRRRDITGIFLGTGMGPRSYSIIEQGMVSRLIEAKPEDLRQYLEEAAGISKYKERRRETELRIEHTRANLARLNDVRDELSKQLEHLQRQANAAERYKVLKQEERLVKAQLLALRWQALHGQLETVAHSIQQEELQLEAEQAEQANIEASVEQCRFKQTELSDIFSEVQARYYRYAADATRLEQAIAHQRERSAQLSADLAQAERALAEAQQHLSQDEVRINELNTALIDLAPAAQQATAQVATCQQNVALAEQALRESQLQWEEINQQAAEAMRRAEVECLQMQYLEQRLQQGSQRLDKLKQEAEQLGDNNDDNEISQIQQEIAQLAEQKTLLQTAQQELQNSLAAQRERNRMQATELDKARSELQKLHGRRASVEALQQAALGNKRAGMQAWLQGQNLQDVPRLAQKLQVEPGWERAVETILGVYLEALCVEDIASVATAAAGLQQGTLVALALSATGQEQDNSPAPHQATPLLAKVSAFPAAQTLLQGIYIAGSLPEALAIASSLKVHESVITPEGTWLGQGWLYIAREANEKAGVLQRERELTELQQLVVRASEEIAQQQQQLEQGNLALQALETEREANQTKRNEIANAAAQADARLRVQQARSAQLQQRRAQLENDSNELHAHCQRDQQQLMTTREQWQTTMAQVDALAVQRETLQQERDEKREALEEVRNAMRLHQQTLQQAEVRLQATQAQLAAIEQNCGRAKQQVTDYTLRCEHLRQNLQDSAAPLDGLLQERETALANQAAVDAEQTEIKQQLNQAEHVLQTQEKKRNELEQKILTLRNRLENLRMQSQGLSVRCQTLQEQLQESSYELAQLLQDLPAETTETQLEDVVRKTEQRIERMGAINLAAIEEFATQSERKTYLDTQVADLEAALSTLEEAMHKIDKETRQRFKETFDQVNQGFQALFPRIFGGGSAALELTGQDLLDTGVALMARPPGKRNSSIHLLSGGEKALTAIALVFAIFQLNPAPFCMLDEVDAPLDDANIGRFCTLVTEMAQKIQFIFITHNKLAMEMANQLIGVTMNEPGVSRLVAVDVEEAMAMAV